MLARIADTLTHRILHLDALLMITVTAIVLPVVWIGWMLGRGPVIDAYPYGFVNVIEWGDGPVLGTTAMILAFGLMLRAALWGVERLLVRRSAQPPIPWISGGSSSL